MRPTLINIFGLPIRSYGFMLALGFSFGLWRLVWLAQKRDIDQNKIYDLAIIILLSGIIGARLVYILLNYHTLGFLDFFKVWDGGLSFHGGLAAGFLSAWLYIKQTNLQFLECIDILAPSVAIGYAFTRIGCFLNGCCYGSPTDLPWACKFNENGILTPPSHPAQLYASIINIIIFVVLVRLEKQNKWKGFVFTSYIAMYGVYRFLIEFLRSGYSADMTALGITQAQVVSLIMTITTLIMIKKKA